MPSLFNIELTDDNSIDLGVFQSYRGELLVPTPTTLTQHFLNNAVACFEGVF